PIVYSLLFWTRWFFALSLVFVFDHQTVSMFLFGLQKKKEERRSLGSKSKHTRFKRSKTSICIERIDLAFGTPLNKDQTRLDRPPISLLCWHPNQFVGFFAPSNLSQLYEMVHSFAEVSSTRLSSDLLVEL